MDENRKMKLNIKVLKEVVTLKYLGAFVVELDLIRQKNEEYKVLVSLKMTMRDGG